MKTLWIGCSHSAGIYSDTDERISKFGIPYLVSKEFDSNNWKMIAAPGHGIIEYSCILSHLDNNNLLDNFSNIILQLTQEPRLLSYTPTTERIKYKTLTQYITNNNERECPVYMYDLDETHPYRFDLEFNTHPVNLYNAYKDQFTNKEQLLDMTERVTGSVQQSLTHHVSIHFNNILSIVSRRNLKLHTFNFSESNGVTKFLRNKDYKKYDILDGRSIVELAPSPRNEYFVHGASHPKEKGVMFTTQQIVNALRDKI